MADDRSKALRRQLAAQQRDAAAARKVADAQAAAQQAENQRLKTENAMQQLKHQAEQQTGSKLALGQLKNAALMVPVVGGGVVGFKIANKIGAKIASSQAVNVKRFQEVARAAAAINNKTQKQRITGTVKGDKLGALVKEGYGLGGVKSGIGPGGTIAPKFADKRLFAKAGGSSGLSLVVPLAVEGAVTSFVLPRYVESDSAKEALRWTGSASIAAALSFKTKRAIDKQSSALRPSGTAVAEVVAAHDRLLREGMSRKVAVGGMTPIPTKSGNVTTFRQVAARSFARGVSIGAPIVAGAAVFDAVRSSAKAAGESNTVAMAKASAAGIVAGGAVAGSAFGVAKASAALSKVLPTAGKVLARAMPAVAVGMAAYSAVQGYRQGGVKGAAEGVADFATFGAYSWGKKALAGPATGMARVQTVRTAMAQRAAVHAAYNARVGAARALAGPRRGGDGMTAGYTRVQGGRTVRVSGYRTPTRGR